MSTSVWGPPTGALVARPMTDPGAGAHDLHVAGLGPLPVAAGTTVSGPCRVMLRPEDWEALAAGGTDGFVATVEARFFLGANVRLQLRVGVGGLPLLLDAPAHALPAAVAPGDVVRVRVRPGVTGRIWEKSVGPG